MILSFRSISDQAVTVFSNFWYVRLVLSQFSGVCDMLDQAVTVFSKLLYVLCCMFFKHRYSKMKYFFLFNRKLAPVVACADIPVPRLLAQHRVRLRRVQVTPAGLAPKTRPKKPKHGQTHLKRVFSFFLRFPKFDLEYFKAHLKYE